MSRSLAVVALAGGCVSTPPPAQQLDAGVDGGGDGEPNIAFVTSSEHTGDLGGLLGADEICDLRAREAGLEGIYVAWLSSAAIDAPARLAGARGWIRTDGRPFADSIEDIIAGEIFFPLRIDEAENDLVSAPVWTGTDADGTFNSAEGGSCSGWIDPSSGLSARTGLAEAGTFAWTQRDTESCSELRHLYCFGTDREVPVSIEPEVGRIAFISLTGRTPISGLANFNLACETEAAAAKLSGNFIALVGLTSEAAVDRLDLSGAPWVRPDGVPIVAAAADLGNGTPLLGAITQTAGGTYRGGAVWTGGPFASAVSDQRNNCANWAAAPPAHNATFGIASSTSSSLEGAGVIPCDAPTALGLLCFEN